MLATPEALAPHLHHTAASLAAVLATVRRDGAAATRLLDADGAAALAASARALDMVPAEATAGAYNVRQDFDITSTIPSDTPLAAGWLAAQKLIDDAAQHLDPPPFQPFTFNEGVVQRYARGAQGISPHRDQGRYRNLIAIIVLSGEAPFYHCRDRAGSGAVELTRQPGDMILMKAPGFDGERVQPFHYVGPARSERISYTLRYDKRLDPAAA